MGNEVELGFKKIGDIEGKFYVPSYQRGYRWGKNEVERLLEDIYQEGDKPYCLQPVAVIKKGNNTYDLVDGQQRLTTLYLIKSYLFKLLSAFGAPKYELTYQTRTETEFFLKNIDESRKNDNVDFWYISNAYKVIKNWFESNDEELLNYALKINLNLSKNVEIIWYEIGDDTDAIALFNRLNIGKIPLTNAELAKALFLRKRDIVDADRDKEKVLREQEKAKRNEIALQWDNIELELNNKDFWAFLTNENRKYQTKIDLLLDLITEKSLDEKNEYYSFLRIDELYKKNDELWKDEVLKTFLVLKDWFENSDYFHKIGYLIATESKSLLDIFKAYRGKKKDEFIDDLNKMIKESVSLPSSRDSYEELSYEKDSSLITNILLLFNIETVRKADNKTQRFSFERYKNNDIWSLEHIHAQKSEISSHMSDWIEWIRLHINSVRYVAKDEPLAAEMQKIVDNEKIGKNDFNEMREKVFRLLSYNSEDNYIHSIANLALLDSGNNAALSNSTFDVKRNKIIQKDKQGEFIPFCTKMVFLKYYTKSENSQVHFWGHEDRKDYIDAINECLKEYLEKPINIDEVE